MLQTESDMGQTGASLVMVVFEILKKSHFVVRNGTFGDVRIRTQVRIIV